MFWHTESLYEMATDFYYIWKWPQILDLDKDFILQLMTISAIDKRLCQSVKSLKYD